MRRFSVSWLLGQFILLRSLGSGCEEWALGKVIASLAPLLIALNAKPMSWYILRPLKSSSSSRQAVLWQISVVAEHPIGKRQNSKEAVEVHLRKPHSIPYHNRLVVLQILAIRLSCGFVESFLYLPRAISSSLALQSSGRGNCVMLIGAMTLHDLIL
jgi:hypothetical protein